MSSQIKFSKFLQEQQVTDPAIGDDAVVLVNGIGMMKVGQVKAKVTRMLAEVAHRAADPDANWMTIKKLMSHSALNAYIDTLISVQEGKQ